MTVGANFFDRHDIANIFAIKIAAIATVTICAVLRVNFFALPAELRIDRERVFGRLLVEQPLLDPRHLFKINRWRKRARAKCSALVALLHHAVIAIPVGVNVFLFAQALQPDRWQIAEPNQLSRFQLFQRKFQKCFGGIKRVGAAGACVRFPVGKTEMTFQHEQSLAHERDRVIAHEKSIDEIVSAADRFNLGHHPWSVEALVGCACENETLESLQIDGVRRHASVDDGASLRRFAHGTSVTNRAI